MGSDLDPAAQAINSTGAKHIATKVTVSHSTKDRTQTTLSLYSIDEGFWVLYFAFLEGRLHSIGG